MKYQTNPSHGPFINAWGCHICSILEKVEKSSALADKPFRFSNSDVGAVYLTAIRHGFIQQEEFTPEGKPFDGCTVLNYDEHGKWDGHGAIGLFNIAAEMFDLPVRCTEYRREGKEYHPVNGEEEILELKRNGYHGSHYVSGNGNSGVPLHSEIEFDPWEGGSQCAKTGWIESKRILTWKRW